MQVSNISSSALTGDTGIIKFLPCTPASACQGSGKCAVGYETPENSCVGCMEGYYRLSGECVECPALAHLFLALYIGVAVVFGIIGLLLVKKGPSIAVTGIGVDYYQVLSIFISFDIKVRNTRCVAMRISSRTLLYLPYCPLLSLLTITPNTSSQTQVAWPGEGCPERRKHQQHEHRASLSSVHRQL